MRNKIPGRPRFAYVSKSAWSVIEHFGFHFYPIDLDAIYKALPIVAHTYQYYMSMWGVTLDEYICSVCGIKDGFSVYDKGNNLYVVSYNTHDMTQARIRWTLAHELGHIILNHFSEFDATSLCGPGLTEEEYGVLDAEANTFASELLCSPAMVGLLPDWARNTDAVSRFFFVSKQAAEKAIAKWDSYPGLHSAHAAFFKSQFPSYISHESA